MATEPTRSGWHRGMVSAVRFAAWIPATRATASTSPLVTSRLATATVVSGRMKTLHRAVARRWDGSFGVTSTMRARPNGSRWVKVWSDTAGKSRSAGRRHSGARCPTRVAAAVLGRGPAGATTTLGQSMTHRIATVLLALVTAGTAIVATAGPASAASLRVGAISTPTGGGVLFL